VVINELISGCEEPPKIFVLLTESHRNDAKQRKKEIR
jgi:hypothetical protein